MKKTQDETLVVGAGPALSQWVKSSKCSAGVCVETRVVPQGIQIRDSKQNDLGKTQPLITLSDEAFELLQQELLGHPVAGGNDEVKVVEESDGWFTFIGRSTGVALRFDKNEISAFVAGIEADEFRREVLLAAA